MTISSVTIVRPVAIPHMDASADQTGDCWPVLRLFAPVRFVVHNKCFIQMFWLVVKQS